MGQSGLFVPSMSATLSIVDRIFTRIGSSDDLSANQSTFMIEMKETASILKNATKRSLVIMDEVGRGTSTKDGMALALAIIDHLVQINSTKCIFATHYHELAPLISSNLINGVSFYKAACLIDSSNEITCLHKIVPGVMDQSHGIKVAKVAGLPNSVIEKATQFYKQL
jgi:DNA mismatch repair protein MutS